MFKPLQTKTKIEGGYCDENPAVASSTSLPTPELNQKKVYMKRSAKNEAKVKWGVKPKLLKGEKKKPVKRKLFFHHPTLPSSRRGRKTITPTIKDEY